MRTLGQEDLGGVVVGHSVLHIRTAIQYRHTFTSCFEVSRFDSTHLESRLAKLGKPYPT